MTNRGDRAVFGLIAENGSLWRKVLGILVLLWFPLHPLRAADVRAGAASVNITPPPGSPMAGYYHPRDAEGVLDDLHAKALVLDDGLTRVAFVALDLISTTRPLVEQARAEIERSTGLKGEAVMISATHAHTGPVLSGRGSREDALGAAGAATAEYVDRLPRLIAESVRLAEASLTNAELRVARGRCDDLAFNRRFYLRDGTVAWNPGKLNPDVVLPAGVTDPEVGVLLVEPPHPPSQWVPAIATYVNFALHPDTTGGARISADYPGVLARRLAEYHGTNNVTVFANGTCGNLNHVDVNWARAQSSPQEAARLGTLLAASVFQAEKSLRPVRPAPLRIKHEMVLLDLPAFTPEQLEQARRDVRTAKDNTREGFMKLVRGHRVLDTAAREGRPLEVEVQVITLGDDLAWVSLPGEVFVELGLAIKKGSPFRQTFIAELANGSIGYIPDRRSYAEGNYEPESARCAAGSGEKLVDAALRLLRELKP